MLTGKSTCLVKEEDQLTIKLIQRLKVKCRKIMCDYNKSRDTQKHTHTSKK